MKIKPLINLTLLCLIASQPTIAQEAEPAVAKVHYIFTHINDTTQRDKYQRDEVVTYLGKTGSYYTSYSSTRVQEDMQKQMNDPAFDGNLQLSSNTTGIAQSYLYDQKAQQLREVTRVGSDDFLLQEEYPALNWAIADETKTIGGYTCQKAQVPFKGRNYTAWFTTELPFSAGPWKLHGLPGLILEASDDKNEVQFTYSGFDKMEDGVYTIKTPENALVSTRKEVAKLQDAFKANPQAYMQAKRNISTTTGVSGGSGSIVIRSSGTSSGSTSPKFDTSKIKSINVKKAEGYAPSRVTNNPIELTP